MKKSYKLSPAQHTAICDALQARAHICAARLINSMQPKYASQASAHAWDLAVTVHALTAMNQRWTGDLSTYDHAMAILQAANDTREL